MAGRQLLTALAMLLALAPWVARASGINFDAATEISASAQDLSGTLTLTLRSEQSIYNAQVFVRGQSERKALGRIEHWSPDAAQRLAFQLHSPHHAPGLYHLLVEIAFQDMAGAHLSASIALDYQVADAVLLSPLDARIAGEQITWLLDRAPPDSAHLTVLPPPPWQLVQNTFSPRTRNFELQAVSSIAALPDWDYPETARLDWIENGIHGSKLIEWRAQTDPQGQWLRSVPPAEQPGRQSKLIGFDASATITADASKLQGEITLSFTDSGPLQNVELTLHGQDPIAHSLGRIERWEPATPQRFDLSALSLHPYPGVYHALVQIRFEDERGQRFSRSVGIEYRVERAAVPARGVAVELRGNQLAWSIGNLDPRAVQLTLTTEPAWQSQTPLTALDAQFTLTANGSRNALPNWQYPQRARLEWLDNGVHHSRVFDWTAYTDSTGAWSPTGQQAGVARWWRNTTLLSGLAALFAIAAVAVRWRPPATALTAAHQEWLGVAMVLLLSAWLISHAQPSLWFLRTWSTGGDVASHVFYANVFMDWFAHGKISGWLPESFAGFPAFTFYFPLPFILATLFAIPFEPQIGFKLASMLPAFLLPAATYLLGACLRWPVATRLLAAGAAAGFISAEETSIWGGNVLAQLSGEFAYSWGMLNAVLFWSALAWALRGGGKRWLLAAVLEALVALSHGYALLMAGFGAFTLLLFSAQPWRDLRTILQVHTVAFLLIGFWLMPLAQNLPWTIPNDTSTTLESWQVAWPHTLWPLAVGLPLIVAALRWSKESLPGIGVVVALGMLGLLGFHVGHNIGLAESRFFPYAQWGFAVACAGALGWALQRGLGRAALPAALACVLGLMAWWEPHIANMEGWSRWNLLGYETKPLWPHYQQTAKANAGPLDGPRVIFEHDPDNSDVGSTRAMEALPLFGSRPALEGLYMESSITSPFIYQLQEEISRRPSAPLSRYPTTPRPMDRAVSHLNELYTNRLILRSEMMKQRFGSDPRFVLIAEHGPFQTYELKDFHTQLVDVVTEPLAAHDRKAWLDHAFRRFTLEHPYATRHVYLKPGETLPKVNAAPAAGTHVKVVEFARERLVFETDAPGVPHIVRMTYSPRWQSASGEPVYLIEPSFMMVVPKGQRVELVYSASWGNWIGDAFSVMGIAIVLIALAWRHGALPATLLRTSPIPLLVAATLAVCALAISWWTDPEHIYHRGHRYLAENQWIKAAQLFDQTEQARKVPAAHAEALFWAARAYHLGDDKAAAQARYERLRTAHPENYWYAESVYRLIEIALADNQRAQAEQLYAELNSQLPGAKWTGEARRLLGIADP